MAFLVVSPALNRASRSFFNNLARFLAGCCGAPAWVTAATQMSGPYAGRALRWSTAWALTNHALLRLVPPETTLSILPKLPKHHRAGGGVGGGGGVGEVVADAVSDAVAGAVDVATSVAAAVAENAPSTTGGGAGAGAGAGVGGEEIVLQSLTFREVQGWWFGASTRILLAVLCIIATQWVMHAKRPPPLPPIPAAAAAASSAVASSSSDNEARRANGKDSSEDFVAAHFAALRADEGVSWDRQARSVLVDSVMSLVVYAISTVAVVGFVIHSGHPVSFFLKTFLTFLAREPSRCCIHSHWRREANHSLTHYKLFLLHRC